MWCLNKAVIFNNCQVEVLILYKRESDTEPLQFYIPITHQFIQQKLIPCLSVQCVSGSQCAFILVQATFPVLTWLGSPNMFSRSVSYVNEIFFCFSFCAPCIFLSLIAYPVLEPCLLWIILMLDFLPELDPSYGRWSLVLACLPRPHVAPITMNSNIWLYHPTMLYMLTFIVLYLIAS